MTRADEGSGARPDERPQTGGEADPPAREPDHPDTREGRSRRGKPRRPRADRRPLLVRLFALSPWGAVKLVLLCILVGVIVMAANFDPRSPDVDVATLAGSLARDAWNAAVWSVRNFWQPALAGAGIVLPLWVLWRLVSLPFRR